MRWCDIQRFVDPHGLAVKIMQTYANFTVGGALSVNCHGRYIGLGPLVLSVRSLKLVLHDGSVVEAQPAASNAELFFGAIGGYGALGVIVEVELDLAENTRVKRDRRDDAARRVHGASSAAPCATTRRRCFTTPTSTRRTTTTVRSVTWVETDEPATHADPAAAAVALLSAAPVLPLGDLRDAVRQVSGARS